MFEARKINQMTHALQTPPSNFELINSGKKSFFPCKDDRPFNEGDSVLIQEYDKNYTGREFKGHIVHISTDSVKSGHVILGIKETEI